MSESQPAILTSGSKHTGRRRPEENTHSTQISVEKSITDNIEKSTSGEAEDELIEVHRFITEPSIVSLSFGYTHNLGNFRSAKLNISLSRPCYREEEDACLETVTEFLKSRFEPALEELLSAIKKHVGS